MKAFNVYLRDGRVATVLAETYRQHGNLYVFDKPGAQEIQFFVGSEIVGISEAAPSQVQGITHSPPELHADLATGRLARPSHDLLAKTQQQTIARVLAECGGNRTRTARELGISRRALVYKLKKMPEPQGDCPVTSTEYTGLAALTQQQYNSEIAAVLCRQPQPRP